MWNAESNRKQGRHMLGRANDLETDRTHDDAVRSVFPDHRKPLRRARAC